MDKYGRGLETMAMRQYLTIVGAREDAEVHTRMFTGEDSDEYFVREWHLGWIRIALRYLVALAAW